LWIFWLFIDFGFGFRVVVQVGVGIGYIVRSLVLILTRNNGSELKTSAWGRLSQGDTWSLCVTVHFATACQLCLIS
jgi:hypothetical protein